MAINMTGEVFGHLTVQSRVGTTPCGSAIWRCLCACGRLVDASRRHLVVGDSRSCGCRRYLDRRGTGSYYAAHQFIRKMKGSATEHLCVDCGGAARDWSFLGASGGFSWDPAEYVARCKPCHTIFDKEERS
jgi:hypothetical protein